MYSSFLTLKRKWCENPTNGQVRTLRYLDENASAFEVKRFGVSDFCPNVSGFGDYFVLLQKK